MRDLTHGSLSRHLLALAAPIAGGMLVQTLYYLVDLYFVAGLGPEALAGVSAAGNVMFLIIALTQMLSVGTVALIAHAVGRKDRAGANRVFNQTVLLSAACGLLVLGATLAGAEPYLRLVAADAASREAGVVFLYWLAPGLALQFALVAMGAALRGTGVVKPTMLVQIGTVGVNILLAPVLIAGWGTGKPLGVAGAGLASTLSVVVGVALLAFYFARLENYVGYDRRHLRPNPAILRRLLSIGLPAGGEFICLFLFMVVIYAIISAHGAAAQAGFGIGSRLMQAIFLPGLAISFAIAPLAGQNFGAGHTQRVRDTLRHALLLEGAIMLGLTLLCQLSPAALIGAFTRDPEVLAVGAGFLRIISWNFLAMGIVFACSGMFQALGNTWPGFLTMLTRLLTFALPALWLARQPSFRLEHVWYASVASVALQALMSLWLVRAQLKARLAVPAAAALEPDPAPVN